MEWHDTADRQDTDETKSDYLFLTRLARDLCTVAEIAISEQHEIEHKGFPWFHHFVNIVLLNQLHYMEDMIALVPNRTAELIARTMVEGFIKLKWMAQDRQSRAKRWFSFIWLQQWKYATRQESRGHDVRDDKRKLLAEIRDQATDHLTKAGKRALTTGNDLDPFKHFEHDWTGLSAYELAQATELTNLYARFYDPLNDWIHWSPKGYIKSSDVDEQGISYTFRSYYQSTASLVGGIASLLSCLELWNDIYQAGHEAKIAEIDKRFSPFSPL